MVARVDPQSECNEKVDLKLGEVVIVMSPDTPRGKWPLGRIVKVFPEKDSEVRIVDVQVGKTVLETNSINQSINLFTSIRGVGLPRSSEPEAHV